MSRTISVFDTNALLTASLPVPTILAPHACGRVAAVKTFWRTTLGVTDVTVRDGPDILITAPTPEAVEHAVSAYSWMGLDDDQAFDEVSALVLSGLCNRMQCTKCSAVRRRWGEAAHYVFR